MLDVIIVGGGPAGVAAGIYCARKGLKSVLITTSFGGQSVVSDNIQNWIGEQNISGIDLAKKLEEHLKSYPEVGVVEPSLVVKIETAPCVDKERICDFKVTTDKNEIYDAKALIIASGARRKRLGVTNEDKFEGRGVSYCSTCDAPLFKDKKVVVIGGGNAGLEAVQDLIKYAKEVYLLHSKAEITGDPTTLEEIKKQPKLKEIILSVKTTQILGEQSVTGIKYQDLNNNRVGSLSVDGVFVEIGSVPNSEIVKDLVQLDEHGQIMINFQHARTSHPGIFAAGDVTNDPYKQNNISAGDGVRAALAAHSYIMNLEKLGPAAEQPHT